VVRVRGGGRGGLRPTPQAARGRWVAPGRAGGGWGWVTNPTDLRGSRLHVRTARVARLRAARGCGVVSTASGVDEHAS